MNSKGLVCLLSGVRPDGEDLSAEANSQLCQLESAIQDLLTSSIVAPQGREQSLKTIQKEAVAKQLWILCCRLWVGEPGMHGFLRWKGTLLLE